MYVDDIKLAGKKQNITDEKKFQIENVFSLTEKKGLFLSMYVDDFKMAGNKQNLDPMWKLLMKEVGLGEQHHSLTMFIWVAVEENAKQAKIWWTIAEICLNHELPRAELKNYHARKI